MTEHDVSLTRRHAARLTPLCVAAALLAGVAPAQAGAQDLRYSLTPSVAQVRWDNALGLEDASLYGGRLGFTFGEYIGLQGYYLTSRDFDSQFDDLSLTFPDGTALGQRTYAVNNYGADIVFNLRTGKWNPFVKAGGSILRFEPNESDDDVSQIALKYGGGIRLGAPGGLQLQLLVEDLLFRVNRFDLAENPDQNGSMPQDPDADDTRHNLVLGAGLIVPLGGARAVLDDRPEFSLGDLALPIEVMAGALDFDDQTGLGPSQEMVGVRTGLNFGPFVGLRGYYWRGVTSGFDATEPVQSWGGEAQFNLNHGAGLTPFLLAGAGELDFKSDFRDAGGNPRDDRTALILGGGLGLQMTEQLRLNLTARDYLFSEGDIEDVSSRDELRSNWLFSAGVSFAIGANQGNLVRPRTERVRTARVDTVYLRADGEPAGQEETRAARTDSMLVPVAADREATQRVAERTPPAAATSYAGDRLIELPVPAQGELYVRYGPADTTVTDGAPRAQDDAPPAGPWRTVRPMDRMDRRTMDGLSTPELRALIRDELERASLIRERDAAEAARGTSPARTNEMPAPARRDTMQSSLRDAGQRPQQMTAAELEAFEERIAMRLRAERDTLLSAIRAERESSAATIAPEAERRLLMEIQRTVQTEVRQELDRRETRQEPQTQTVVVVPPADTGRRYIRPAGDDDAPRQWEPQRWSGYSGFSANAGTQLLLGARANLGSISPGAPDIHVVPEFAFGFGGGGTSTLLQGNLQYRFGEISVRRLGGLHPYASLGLGLLNYTAEIGGREGLDFVLTPSYGISAALPGLGDVAGTGASEVFLEHQGISFFDVNRILFGLQWRL